MGGCALPRPARSLSRSSSRSARAASSYERDRMSDHSRHAPPLRAAALLPAAGRGGRAAARSARVVLSSARTPSAAASMVVIAKCLPVRGACSVVSPLPASAQVYMSTVVIPPCIYVVTIL